MDWERLGKEVEQQRGRLGFASRRDFADATKFAEKTLGDIENARRDTYSAITLARLERALRWPPGTVDAILNGLPAPESHPRATPTELLAGRPLPLLAVELAIALHPDSPLTNQDRQRVEALVDHVLAPYRHLFAGWTARRDEAG